MSPEWTKRREASVSNQSNLHTMNTYFDGTGTYQGTFDKLWAKYVPAQGESPIRHGEAIRCIGRFCHEIYNNGAGNAIREREEYGYDFDRYYEGMAHYLESYCYGNGKASMYHRLLQACRSAYQRDSWNEVMQLFEPLMDEVIVRAAHDEKIIPTA